MPFLPVADLIVHMVSNLFKGRMFQFFLGIVWGVQVVLQTKELITKQAGKIAKRADEHEAFITKVFITKSSCKLTFFTWDSSSCHCQF